MYRTPGDIVSISDDVQQPRSNLLMDDSGEAMHRLVAELYPICRSITGSGVRETLSILLKHIPLKICEVPSGLPVFDWKVPFEWNIRDAYIKNGAGERIVDFQKSNLHVVSYSTPVRKRVDLAELKQHLFSDPDHPDWIPYRTSYYNEDWGFCLPHSQLVALEDDDYEVCVDASLEPGHLTYGELVLRGHSADEVLISCHICHPSLCNDNLSGIAVACAMSQQLAQRELKYSYRFLFVPGTIGAITWAAIRQSHLNKIKHGFVLTCAGDAGAPTYKRSRRHDAEIDRAWSYVLNQSGEKFHMQPFSPYGYDERQYCSPGLDLPIGAFMRTPYGEFPEYHTSADNLEFVDAKAMHDSREKALTVIDVLEHNRIYFNLKPLCEPKLGDYGLYSSIGGTPAGEFQMAILWLLNMSDGTKSLLDVAERCNLTWGTLKKAVQALVKAQLLRPIDQLVDGGSDARANLTLVAPLAEPNSI